MIQRSNAAYDVVIRMLLVLAASRDCSSKLRDPSPKISFSSSATLIPPTKSNQNVRKVLVFSYIMFFYRDIFKKSKKVILQTFSIESLINFYNTIFFSSITLYRLFCHFLSIKESIISPRARKKESISQGNGCVCLRSFHSISAK